MNLYIAPPLHETQISIHMDYVDYRSGADAMSYQPQLFRITQREEAEHFNLLVSDPDLVIHDTLQIQLAELLKTRHIGKYRDAEALRCAVNDHLGALGLHEYGVWVFYPWCRRLVHILDEAEFIELRTSRNKYKITAEEQEMLQTKTVGIVGLSVGSSVAYTMAMERSCGKLLLADFDTIELSNLNRIRASLKDLGLNKAVLMAREIAEIDPFLQVEVYHEGLHAQNMETFISQLHLLIDECDSLEMKLKMRLVAKSKSIAVLMETSDRGMLDIERFDQEPNRPLFHGRIEHINWQDQEGSPSRELAQQLLTAIVDVEKVSDRMKMSYAELGKSIGTWPQLASAVVLGGGTVADTARRLLLGEDLPSGRYYIDLSTIIPSS